MHFELNYPMHVVNPNHQGYQVSETLLR